MTKVRQSAPMLSAILAITIFGCGDPGRGSVKGRVTIDEQPLEEGRIAFYPTGETSGPVAGGVIENGSYFVARKKGPFVGKYRVEINASMRTGEPQPLTNNQVLSPGELTPEDIYRIRGIRPLVFEAQVPLEVDIKAGRNVYDFPLRSKDVASNQTSNPIPGR